MLKNSSTFTNKSRYFPAAYTINIARTVPDFAHTPDIPSNAAQDIKPNANIARYKKKKKKGPKRDEERKRRSDASNATMSGMDFIGFGQAGPVARLIRRSERTGLTTQYSAILMSEQIMSAPLEDLCCRPHEVRCQTSHPR